MIDIVDFGVGNLRSVQKAFEAVGYAARIISEADQIASSRRLVLPGVGAFGDAMVELQDRGFVPALQDYVRSGHPFLGICVGMQVLFETSDERGQHAGLSILPGHVRRFDLPSEFKVPHMGWNRGTKRQASSLLRDLPESAYYYFVHSYYVVPADSAMTALECDYGHSFCAMVSHENIHATQFHPEKSQQAGLALITAFARL